jgi:hypothetical protein
MPSLPVIIRLASLAALAVVFLRDVRAARQREGANWRTSGVIAVVLLVLNGAVELGQRSQEEQKNTSAIADKAKAQAALADQDRSLAALAELKQRLTAIIMAATPRLPAMTAQQATTFRLAADRTAEQIREAAATLQNGGSAASSRFNEQIRKIEASLRQLQYVAGANYQRSARGVEPLPIVPPSLFQASPELTRQTPAAADARRAPSRESPSGGRGSTPEPVTPQQVDCSVLRTAYSVQGEDPQPGRRWLLYEYKVGVGRRLPTRVQYGQTPTYELLVSAIPTGGKCSVSARMDERTEAQIPKDLILALSRMRFTGAVDPLDVGPGGAPALVSFPRCPTMPGTLYLRPDSLTIDLRSDKEVCRGESQSMTMFHFVTQEYAARMASF